MFDLSFYAWEEIISISDEFGMTENTFGGFLARFVKAIHIELPDKAIDFFVAKKPWQDNLLKLTNVLNDKLPARWCPKNHFVVFFGLDES